MEARRERSQEAVGYKVARKRQADLLVHDRSGAIAKRARHSRSWFDRLSGR